MIHINGRCTWCNIKGESCSERGSKTCPNLKAATVHESIGPAMPKDFKPEEVKQVRPEDYFTTE